MDECDHPWKPYCKDCIPASAAMLHPLDGECPPPPADEGLREAYLAGVRRGASDGMEGYPMVADDWLAARRPAVPPEGLDVEGLARAIATYNGDATESNDHFIRWTMQVIRAYLRVARLSDTALAAASPAPLDAQALIEAAPTEEEARMVYREYAADSGTDEA